MNNRHPWFVIFYQNGYLLTLIILLLMVAGLSAIQNLPRLEDPRIDNRNVVILTPFPGASAQRVEALITDTLEESLKQLDEISDIKSTSKAGLSSISVELQPWITSANNEPVFSKIRDQIAQASKLLPTGAGTPLLDDKRGATAFTLIAALKPTSHDDTGLILLNRLAEELADRLRRLPGTELVRIYGGVNEEVHVNLDAEQLQQIELSFAEVSAAINQADTKKNAGSLETTQYTTRLQLGGDFSELSELRELPLRTNSNGAFLTLGDVADIKRGYTTPRQEIALIDGQEGIFVAARMRTSARVDVWTQQTNELITAFHSQYQANLAVDPIFQQSTYTKARLSDLSGNLLQGSLVVVLVVLFFMGTKAAFIVGLSLPLSAAFALFTLSFFNQQIHQMTIFGMILAVGLLIDNAIVITDVIRREIQIHQRGRIDAFIQGLRHLSAPLTASTLTTVLAFMPVFLLPGNIGDFIRPIAISVVMALIGSLAISLCVIAPLAARYLPIRTEVNTRWWAQGWQWPTMSKETKKLILFFVVRPWLTVISVTVLSISGVLLSMTLSNIFFPDADRDQFQIYMWQPHGNNINSTQRATQAVDAFIRSQPDIKQVTWLVGGSTPSVYYNQIMSRDGTPHFANAVVTASSVKAAANLITPLQQQLSDEFPSLKFVVRRFSQGPPVSAPVAVEIYGPDLSILAELGQQVRLAMSKTAGITETLASVEYLDTELKLAINPQDAALIGLNYQMLNSQLFNALEGVTGGSLLQQTEELPVRVKLDFKGADYEKKGNFEEMLALNFINQTHLGKTATPVYSVGDWQLESKISGITRTNGQRVNNVEAFTFADVTPIDAARELDAHLRQQGFTLPEGYRLITAGDAGEQKEAVGQLSTFLPVLAVLMFATLILTFNSLKFALLIFIVAGLSSGFGLFSLWLSGLPMGFNPLLGLAGLIGVAINGSIVVIASVNALPIAQRSDVNAIVAAAMSSSRHILSTTVTTVGGLIPLLLLSNGSFWPPLAVVLAGGVGFSILLSLAFTPAALRLLTRPKIDKSSPTKDS